MVCGCPVSITAVCGNEKLIRKSALSSVRDFHLIVDSYVTCKHPKVRTWLAQRPRYHMHYTPPIPLGSTRWKRWFGLITQRAIRRGSFTSVQDLVQKIDAFVRNYNRSSRSFAWTASAESIPQKIARLCSRIYGTLAVATRIAQDKSPAKHSPSSRNINAVR